LFLFFINKAMKLVIATNNIHKVNEIRHSFNNEIELLTLHDIGFEGDIPETEATIEGNAIQKASYIYDRYGMHCFADDTGLEIEALHGAPGVFSARYAGVDGNFENNIKKVLSAMEGKANRRAQFRTVIALVINREVKIFEGIIEGHILLEKRGRNGFGYDPIFQPSGLNKSFAEISLEEKNKISHRAIAVQKLVDYIKSIQ
jgi:XTP/dITP diphosphohydrolase